MGREISHCHFRHEDFHRFERHLVSEMALLHEYFRLERFSAEPPSIGMELEAWLTDANGHPMPLNEPFLEAVDSPLVVPELAQFNVEFNVQHQALSRAGLIRLEQELDATWQKAKRVAAEMDLRLAAIGILPTVQEDDLNLSTMSVRSRYRALNEQVRRLRKGRPLNLEIRGEEELLLEHDNVMLEAAATSLQVHYQVPLGESVRYYNAACIASAPVVSVAANSPLLFGKLLWAETRIPLFEQAVEVGGPYPRVHFGSGYALQSLEEFFLENCACHPLLLPIELTDAVELLPHVRLHNGTIWRWNRPLVGYDATGRPHLRIEHRVMPAGPTLPDMMANIAFSTGLIHYLSQQETAPESQLPFDTAADNFRAAARDGLDATLTWLDGHNWPVGALVEEKLLAHAEEGLEMLDIDGGHTRRALDLIARRVQLRRNGAVWQTAFVKRYGRDLEALTRSYLGWQDEGRPVHEWEL